MKHVWRPHVLSMSVLIFTCNNAGPKSGVGESEDVDSATQSATDKRPDKGVEVLNESKNIL